MQITTTHTDETAGNYDNNVRIIHQALEEHFGFIDQTHVVQDLADCTWFFVSHRDSKQDKQWGPKDVQNALKVAQRRITKLRKKLKQATADITN